MPILFASEKASREVAWLGDSLPAVSIALHMAATALRKDGKQQRETESTVASVCDKPPEEKEVPAPQNTARHPPTARGDVARCPRLDEGSLSRIFLNIGRRWWRMALMRAQRIILAAGQRQCICGRRNWLAGGLLASESLHVDE
jgi:hypothetical protein